MKCKCCETTKEIAEIMAGIATGKYTIEDLKNAMRKKPTPHRPLEKQNEVG